MSANNPSDTTPSEAPVATPAAPAAPVTLDGFGSSRGTGLARGKRPARPASNAADFRDSGIAAYQPTAIQVVVAPTEYVNPFEPAPVAIAPAAESVPATPVAPASPVAVAPAPAPKPAPAPASVPEAKAVVESPAPAPKAELNILPPAAPRPATSWESPGAVSNSAPAPAAPAPATASGDRPLFRIERKPIVAREIEPLRPVESRPEGASYAGRDGRDGGRRRDGQGQGQGRRREGGEGRRDGRRDGPRPAPAPGASTNPAPRPSPAKPAPEKGGGFVGWLKGIFGGGSEAPASGGDQPRGERGPRGEGQGQGRRRRRGGRGRSGGGQGPQAGGENRGPRPEGTQQPRHNGAPRGEGQGGRHRGDRGRGPRPDGSGPRPSEGGSGPAA